MTQVPPSYRVQEAIPVGSIAVQVTDASGSPVAITRKLGAPRKAAPG